MNVQATRSRRGRKALPLRDRDADRAISKLEPEAERYEVNDPAEEGLRVLVHQKRKSWIMRYRRPGALRPTKDTLGVWDPDGATGYEGGLPVGDRLCAADARALAKDINRKRGNRSRDVYGERRTEKIKARAAAAGEGESFSDMARAFIEKYVVEKTGERPKGWRQTASSLGLRFDANGKFVQLVRDGQAWVWRNRSAGGITKADCRQAIRSARKGIPGQRKRKEGERESRSRKLGAALGAFFTWASEEREDVVAFNPMIGVKRGRKAPERKRRFSENEIAVLWRAFGRVGYPFGSILKLLLLTGCRREEINRLEWRELDEALERIDLPEVRTKNGERHWVFLSPQARAIIEAAHRFENCKFVFSANGRGYTKGWVKARRRLDALVIEENGGKSFDEPFVIHDVRRTVVTMMGDELQIPPHVVEAMINHVSGFRSGVSRVYNYAQYRQERIEATNRWGAFIEKCVSPPPSANVVPIRRTIK